MLIKNSVFHLETLFMQRNCLTDWNDNYDEDKDKEFNLWNSDWAVM